MINKADIKQGLTLTAVAECAMIGTGEKTLTYGCVYSVADLNENDDTFSIVDDTGQLHWFECGEIYQYFTVNENKLTNSDAVKNPSHYQLLDGCESITIIASAMTKEQWHGYCLGNIIKYRLRAGNKDKLEQDIAKADFYKELYETHKGLCRSTE